MVQSHYDSMQEALYNTLRDHLQDDWDDALAEATHDAVALVIGVMRGAADAEDSPRTATAPSSNTIASPATSR